MTKREVTLAKARVAGYHGDVQSFTRLLIEGRVRLPFMNAAWREGVAQKAKGVRCTCRDCNPTTQQGG